MLRSVGLLAALALASPSWPQTFLITTVAGNSGGVGDGGPASSARFSRPTSLAADTLGRIYVLDNGRIRVIDSGGIIRTVAGVGIAGSTGDRGPASAARINAVDIGVDRAGAIWLLEPDRIRRVGPGGAIDTVVSGLTGATAIAVADDGTLWISTGSTLRQFDAGGRQLRQKDTARSGVRDLVIDTAGHVYASASFDLITYDPASDNVTHTALQSPGSFVAFDKLSGTLLLPDSPGARVLRIDPSGSIVASLPATNGLVTASVTPTGSVLVLDRGFPTRLLRLSSTAAAWEVIAGAGVGDGSPASLASFSAVLGMEADSSGNLYLADGPDARIRRIDATGVVATVAGTGETGFSGDGGPATAEKLSRPFAVRVDRRGNLLVADTENHRIRRITPDGIIRNVAGTGVAGYNGDGLATEVQLNSPTDLAVDNAGNIYIADVGNQRVRRLGADGRITTVAGTGVTGGAGDRGPAAFAELEQPQWLALDERGNLYVSEVYGDRIRRIDTAQRITTYVSEIAVPQGLAFAADGSLYVAQGVMYRVLRVPPGGGSYVPVAGTGSPGTSGDAGPALSAQLSDPAAIVARPDGLVLFSDIGGGVTWIRRLEAANIFPRAVVNAASFEHAFLSAGELVTIFYTDLPAPENGAVSVRVLFDGVAAPVLFAGPGQINTRIPESLAGRSATALQISVNGRSSNTVGPSLQPTHPGIFAGFINEDGTLNSAANPARRDSIVSLYGTGAGALASTAMLPVEVGIGGVAAEVLYAGPQQVAGVFQINVRIPGAVEVAGAVPVRLVLNGITVDAPAPLAVEPGGAK